MAAPVDFGRDRVPVVRQHFVRGSPMRPQAMRSPQDNGQDHGKDEEAVLFMVSGGKTRILSTI